MTIEYTVIPRTAPCVSVTVRFCDPGRTGIGGYVARRDGDPAVFVKSPDGHDGGNSGNDGSE